MFQIEVAELVVRIENLYPDIRELCRDYITGDDRKADICVSVSEEELQTEIDKAINDPYRQMFPEEAGCIPVPIYIQQECPGCVSGDNTKHTGIYARIRDWDLFEDKNDKTGRKRCDRPFIEICNEINNK